ncbi:MAG: phosphoadenylyl-sulfate reductase [Woeseiaceae bacterium]|nr:phosphoadenylyl-sulfate reductase [Woeseiaceae bacterium]
MTALPGISECPGRRSTDSLLDEAASRRRSLEICNCRLADMPAAQRVRWALDSLPGRAVLSSSFGAQAAVMLHLVTREQPDIPIVLVDTGYLFPETYRFADELTSKLNLDLRVYRAPLSPAWQEARYGRRWEQGSDGLAAYNDMVKVAPMKQALQELDASTWFTGLRRSQANSRSNVPLVSWAGDRWKVHPIADWTDRDVHRYLERHDLPYHPLWQQGYVSIGDRHTTRPIHEVSSSEETRFFGLQRECGLHDIDLSGP